MSVLTELDAFFTEPPRLVCVGLWEKLRRKRGLDPAF
jgi:hypothetical protein